jgi:hypothetical protein
MINKLLNVRNLNELKNVLADGILEAKDKAAMRTRVFILTYESGLPEIKDNTPIVLTFKP